MAATNALDSLVVEIGTCVTLPREKHEDKIVVPGGMIRRHRPLSSCTLLPSFNSPVALRGLRL